MIWKKKCCILSTEEILYFLAKKLRKKYNPIIIIVGKVDGVGTDDLNKNSKAELIKEIVKGTIKTVRNYIKDSAGIDVTGGMKHKVEVLYSLTKFKIKSQIINGLHKGNLKKALKKEKIKGTTIF